MSARLPRLVDDLRRAARARRRVKLCVWCVVLAVAAVAFRHYGEKERAEAIALLAEMKSVNAAISSLDPAAVARAREAAVALTNDVASLTAAAASVAANGNNAKFLASTRKAECEDDAKRRLEAFSSALESVTAERAALESVASKWDDGLADALAPNTVSVGQRDAKVIADCISDVESVVSFPVAVPVLTSMVSSEAQRKFEAARRRIINSGVRLDDADAARRDFDDWTNSVAAASARLRESVADARNSYDALRPFLEKTSASGDADASNSAAFKPLDDYATRLEFEKSAAVMAEEHALAAITAAVDKSGDFDRRAGEVVAAARLAVPDWNEKSKSLAAERDAVKNSLAAVAAKVDEIGNTLDKYKGGAYRDKTGEQFANLKKRVADTAAGKWANAKIAVRNADEAQNCESGLNNWRTEVDDLAKEASNFKATVDDYVRTAMIREPLMVVMSSKDFSHDVRAALPPYGWGDERRDVDFIVDIPRAGSNTVSVTATKNNDPIYRKTGSVIKKIKLSASLFKDGQSAESAAAKHISLNNIAAHKGVEIASCSGRFKAGDAPMKLRILECAPEEPVQKPQIDWSGVTFHVHVDGHETTVYRYE